MSVNYQGTVQTFSNVMEIFLIFINQLSTVLYNVKINYTCMQRDPLIHATFKS